MRIVVIGVFCFLLLLSGIAFWLLPKAEHFPRSYRFTLTQRMMDAALDLQDSLTEAQTHRG